MRVSKSAQYAIRAVVEIAVKGGSGCPVSGASVANDPNLPKKYLSSILGKLKDHGVLVSRRGSHGGYLLARAAHEISLLEVIEAIDGPLESHWDFREMPAAPFNNPVRTKEFVRRADGGLPVVATLMSRPVQNSARAGPASRRNPIAALAKATRTMLGAIAVSDLLNTDDIYAQLPSATERPLGPRRTG